LGRIYHNTTPIQDAPYKGSHMRILSVVAFLLLFALIVASSVTSTTWKKTYGGPDVDWSFSVQQTFDGGYISCGYTKSFGAGAFDIWVVKSDSLGNVDWTKTFGGPINDYGFDAQQTTDGGYIITGFTASYGGGFISLWLIKTDTNGDTLWTRVYGDGNFFADYGFSVRQTLDGGYVIVGSTMSFGEWLNCIWLLRTDAKGDTLWTKTFSSSSDAVGFSVDETDDGGFILTGAKNLTLYTNNMENEHVGEVRDKTITSVESESGLTDLWLIKTNSDGDSLWTKTYGGLFNDIGMSVQQTRDGGYIITGVTGLTDFQNKSIGELEEITLQEELLPLDKMSSGAADVWLLKTDATGDTIWTKIYSCLDNDGGFSVQQTIDGGYIVAGLKGLMELPRSGMSELHNTDTLEPLSIFGLSLSSTANVWLLKTDSNGDTLWTRTYGGEQNDEAFSVEQTTDGGFVLGGGTRSYGEGGEDFWVIKTDSLGLIDVDVDIDLSSDSLFFSPVLIGNQDVRLLWIYNRGTDPLRLDSLISVGDFTLQPLIPPAQSIAATDSLLITITYSPTEAGPHQGTLIIHSNDSDEPVRTVSLSGTGYEPLTVTSLFLADGIAGVPYSETLIATGGIPPYSWIISGMLPPGFLLNISNGIISGISTVAETYLFIVKVTDSRTEPDTARQELTISILPGQLTQIEIVPDSVTLEPGQNQQFTASGSDAYGNRVDILFLWEATGGTIDQDGLYTAGNEDGQFVVTATDPVTSLQDQAAVTILSTVTRGDVNCDGSITPGDALCAFWLSILGSFQDECQCDESEGAADVNCDGNITPGDALCIFWYAITGVWSEECQCE